MQIEEWLFRTSEQKLPTLPINVDGKTRQPVSSSAVGMIRRGKVDQSGETAEIMLRAGEWVTMW